MRSFQDTVETRKQSFISVFFNLHDCTFNNPKNSGSFRQLCPSTQNFRHMQMHDVNINSGLNK